MKIKRKVQMNLPQLIEWAMNNDVRNKSFYGDRYCDEVHFDENKDMTCEYITLTEIFQVEVEEEITEDTEFNIIVLIEKDSCSATWANNSINKLKDNRSKEFHAYIDGEFKLIWRDGRLIE